MEGFESVRGELMSKEDSFFFFFSVTTVKHSFHVLQSDRVEAAAAGGRVVPRLRRPTGR